MIFRPFPQIPTRALVTLYCWLSLLPGTSVRAQVTAPASLDQAESSYLPNLPLDLSELDTLKREVRTRNYAGAEGLLGDALKKNPTSKQLLAFLGRVFFLDGRYDRSIAEFKDAEKHGELDEGERFTLSMAEVVLRHYSDAQSEMESLIQKYPREPLYHYWLSRVHYAQFHLASAISEAKEAIQMDPRFTRGYDQLGLCYEASGQNDLAMQSFKEAVRLNQSAKKPSASPLIDRGTLLYKLNRVSEAESDFREALTYEPGSSQAHFQLGIALEKEGQESDAIQQLREAVSLDPSNAEMHYVLGKALARTGHAPEARAEFTSFERLKNAEPGKDSR